MAPASSPRTAADERWSDAAVARRYARGRFATRRARERDARLVTRLLDAHLPARAARLLDAPHGAGRLTALLASRAQLLVGLDRSAAMLVEAGAEHGTPLVRASATRLPFADESFDAVVCCRLLHHLDEDRELPEVVHELVRVSRRLVIASFWDAGSLQAWRRRVGWRVDASGRRAVSKRRLEALFRSEGARVVGYAHGLRGLSLQTFAAALKEI